ncbi:MAG0920 family protein [Mycoplasma miroungigenitalium]|uniref:MAG0920 family protein n=1 Tax=Mycoplasma miroungigenitalium TaxID=754515 RepID=UPI00358DF03C
MILIFFISFLIIFSVAFIVDIAFLTQIHWGYKDFYYRLISLMVPELGVLTAFVLLIIITMLTIKMLKIGKEIKEWRVKNKDNDFTLFENIVTTPNNQIYNEFNDHEHLMFIITVTHKGKFKYQEASVVKFLYRNWKKKILKFNNRELINEFYYLLIFNYEEIPLNDSFYKINDYAFIFQNKDLLLDEKN